MIVKKILKNSPGGLEDVRNRSVDLGSRIADQLLHYRFVGEKAKHKEVRGGLVQGLQGVRGRSLGEKPGCTGVCLCVQIAGFVVTWISFAFHLGTTRCFLFKGYGRTDSQSTTWESSIVIKCNICVCSFLIHFV